MNKTNIYFFDQWTILIHGSKGLFRLNCPFSVIAVRANDYDVKVGEVYLVDEIVDDPINRIMYCTSSGTFPYHCFNILRKEAPS